MKLNPRFIIRFLYNNIYVIKIKFREQIPRAPITSVIESRKTLTIVKKSVKSTTNYKRTADKKYRNRRKPKNYLSK